MYVYFLYRFTLGHRRCIIIVKRKKKIIIKKYAPVVPNCYVPQYII